VLPFFFFGIFFGIFGFVCSTFLFFFFTLSLANYCDGARNDFD
jgi:hypothetical protein